MIKLSAYNHSNLPGALNVSRSGDATRIFAHPPKATPCNLAIGHVYDIWNDYQTEGMPKEISNWLIKGEAKVNKACYAWFGATFQIFDGQIYYELDEIFDGVFDFSQSGIYREDFYDGLYKVCSVKNYKPSGIWFPFSVSLKNLLDIAGWKLSRGNVNFLTLGGDILGEGKLDIEIKNLLLEDYI